MKNGHTDIDQKLLVLYLLDEISQQNRQVVEAWLNVSEANRNFYESFEKTWTETGKIDRDSVVFDTSKAWHRMEERIAGDREVSAVAGAEKVIGLPKRTIRLFLAAAAILILGVLSVVFVQFLKNQTETGQMVMASLSVPVQDTLTDGSSVILNTKSTLTVPKKFAKKTRTVELQGEAFFEVTRDTARPFIIQTELGQIRVLGTSFQVKAYPDSNLEVYVESGRVELSSVDGTDTLNIVLKAGERGMIRRGETGISRPMEIGADELFWANKKLIFQETRLSVVFDLLKKHYEAQIEVEDSSVLNCLLSATFTNESIDQILEVVAASFDLELGKDQQKFIVKGKGCSNETE